MGFPLRATYITTFNLYITGYFWLIITDWLLVYRRGQHSGTAPVATPACFTSWRPARGVIWSNAKSSSFTRTTTSSPWAATTPYGTPAGKMIQLLPVVVTCRGVYSPKSVFFNLFAAAEPYINVTITHGTPWHAMIRESNVVSKVKFFECLGTDVLKRWWQSSRQKNCLILPY